TWVWQSPRRGRGEDAHETGLRESAHPVPERAGREGTGAHDEPRALGRLSELRAHDRLEREIAEGAGAVPALVARLHHDTVRARLRVELVPRREPGDARDAVPGLAPCVGVEEVRRERIDGLGAEAELREARPRLLRTQTAPPASRARRRSAAACGPG